MNQPQLRPCLQRTSEVSLIFVKYDLSKERPKSKPSLKDILKARKKKKKPSAQMKSIKINGGREVKVGTVLVSKIRSNSCKLK